MNSILRKIISVFIIFNIFAILASSSEVPAKQNAFQKFFAPYLLWTRLNQKWSLFVPSPRKYALQYKAEVIFKDGSKTTWQRPYPPNWDFFGRHLAYNFQKWDLASNYLETKGPLWLDLAHYIERFYANPSNPPVQIKFLRWRADWAPPSNDGYVGRNMNNLRWTNTTLFTYDALEKKML